MSAQPRARVRKGTLATLGERLIGHTSIFTLGTAIETALGVVRLIILTRILEISIFGQLTLLIVFASFVTMFCRLTIVTGSLMAAFRGGDEDELDEDDKTMDKFDQRQVLGTGLLGSLALTGLITLVVAAFAAEIDDALIGTDDSFAIIAAALMGGLNGSFRLVAQVPRFERKPVTYVALQLTHSLLALGLAIALIEAGFGLNGAIGGMALGAAISFLPALRVGWHRFSLYFRWHYVWDLMKLGSPYVGITLGFWAFRELDVVMVSRYLPDTDVALFRVASRIGGLSATAVGAVVLAWGPLMRGPLRSALHREGLLVSASARLLTYFGLAAVWIFVGLFVMQDLLIRIAAPAYADVAWMIPLLGLGGLALNSLLMVYRTSRLRGKRRMLIWFALGMVPLLAVLAIALIPRFGLEGAAAATIITPFVGAVLFLFISQRSAEPLDLPWRRLLVAVVCAALYAPAAFAAVRALPDHVGYLVSIALTAVFPALIVLTGALPREEARTLMRLIRSRLPGQRRTHSLEHLTNEDVDLIDALVRRGRAPEQIAAETDRELDELFTHFVTLLREVGDVGESRATDALVGRYLLAPTNVNLRDREGQLLALEKGVHSMEVDELTTVVDQLKAMSDRQWARATGFAETDG